LNGGEGSQHELRIRRGGGGTGFLHLHSG
jgi:hypothetical protein